MPRLDYLITRVFTPKKKMEIYLGDASGNLETGVDYLYNARSAVGNVPMRVYSFGNVPIVNNWPCIIEKKAGVWVTTETVVRQGVTYPVQPVTPHADTHSLATDGKDPVYILLSQVLAFRAVPVGLTLKIYSHAHLGADWSTPSNVYGIDLSDHIPGVANKACWVMVYLDQAGAFQHLVSATADSVALLVPALIPRPPFGSYPLWGVRLSNGQTEIVSQRDLLDLRMAAWPYNFAIGTRTLTIASGIVTVGSIYHLIRGEGNINDDLDTINGGRRRVDHRATGGRGGNAHAERRDG